MVGLLTLGFGASASVAAPPWATEATVTSIAFTNDTVPSGSDAELSGSWSLPDNPVAPAGFVVGLPAELQGLTDSFALLDPQGEAMGQCAVTATQIVCDFDSAYLATHPRNLSGDFNFWANIRTQVTEDTVTNYLVGGQEVTVVVTPPVGTCNPICEFEGRPSNKTGDYDRNTDTILWTVRVGSGPEGAVGGESMSVDDNLGPNQELLSEFNGESYPKLIHTNQLIVTSGNVEQPGNWRYVPTDQYSISGDVVSWTAQAGYYYAVQYVSRLTDNGAAGTYTNDATVTVDGNDGSVSSEVVRQGGGGTGEGDQVGRFSARKLIDGDGAGLVPDTAVFLLDYSYPAGSSFAAGSGTLELPATGITVTSPNLPAGAVLTLSERAPADVPGAVWEDTVLSSETITIGSEEVVSVTVTNTLTAVPSGAGTVQVVKTLAGDDAAVAAAKDRVFEILVTCQVEHDTEDGETVREEVYSGSLLIRGGQTKYLVDEDGMPRELPLGTHCFAEETDSGGADRIQVDHDSFENAAVVTGGTPDEMQALTINVVNTFKNQVPSTQQPGGSGGQSPLAITGGQGPTNLGLLAAGFVLVGCAVILFGRNTPKRAKL